MNHARRVMPRRGSSHSAEYEPLTGIEDELGLHSSAIDEEPEDVAFSWIEYAIFGFLGMAMLWSWNMFLAAAPYFSSRFADDKWIQSHFQSAILTASTITSLTTVSILTKMQRSASYPFRIALALSINMAVFLFLTVSTRVMLDASTGAYFAFVLTMVAFTSLATGLLQNGTLAFAASFGRPEYMQSLVAGQAVAGILPALAQVASVLIFPPTIPESGAPDSPPTGNSEASAFVYFLAAVGISVIAMFALMPLVRRHGRIMENRITEHMAASLNGIEESERAVRKVISFKVLFRKLRWLAAGVALTFAATMFFPVFTAKIQSVHPVDSNLTPLFRPAAFIPLAFFFWNLGDLVGRMATILPIGIVTEKPIVLFLLAALRIFQLPLYFLCNINGRGAIVSSDFFYLFIVQLLFGLTNGWLTSRIMTSAPDWVEEGEREAAGSFMGLCIIFGLTAGSLLSFTASAI